MLWWRYILAGIAMGFLCSSVMSQAYKWEISTRAQAVFAAIQKNSGYHGISIDKEGLGSLLVNVLESEQDLTISKIEIFEIDDRQPLRRIFNSQSSKTRLSVHIGPWDTNFEYGGAKVAISYHVLDELLLRWLLVSVLFSLLSIAVVVLVLRWAALRNQIQLIQGINLVARQVAHDIRSPLSALKVVVDDPSIPESRRDFVRAAVERISATANDLLKTSRAGQEKVPHTGSGAELVSIQSALEAVAAEKRTEWKGRDATISLAYGKNSVFVRISKAKLAAIISNILNNSIEASAEGQGLVVKISVFDYRKTVIVAVQDNGKGIGAELIPHLGKEEVSAGKADGNGLGLFMAFKYLKSLGGDLKISSQLGQGTTVSLEIPKAEQVSG